MTGKRKRIKTQYVRLLFPRRLIAIGISRYNTGIEHRFYFPYKRNAITTLKFSIFENSIYSVKDIICGNRGSITIF